jgi:amino acid adenylation domain-containing protein
MSHLLNRRIADDDDFFAWGGHSLLAVRLAASLLQELAIDIPLGAVFQSPTPRALATAVAGLRRLGGRPQHPSLDSGRSPRASYVQESFWFLEQAYGWQTTYTVVRAWRIWGAIDLTRLRAALHELRKRHDVFRTVFTATADGTLMTDAPAAEALDLEENDYSSFGSAAKEVALRAVLKDLGESKWDAHRGRLARFTIARMADDEYVFAYALHHSITDDWSLRVMESDLAAIYRDEPPSGLIWSYREFAAWQRSRVESGELDHQLEYWTRQLKGAPATAIEGIRQRPTLPSGIAGEISIELDPTVTARLRHLGAQAGTTPFTVMVTILAILASRYVRSEELVLGVITGRAHAGLERTLGAMINTVCLRITVPHGESFRGAIRLARDVANAAYVNQDIPFDRVVAAVNPSRDAGRQPLVSILTSLEEVPVPLRLGHALAREMPTESIGAQVDLALIFRFQDDALRVRLEYARDLYDDEFIRRLALHFSELTRSLCAMPDAPVIDAGMLSISERVQLAQWNETQRWLRPGFVDEDVVSLRIGRPSSAAIEDAAGTVTYEQLRVHARAFSETLQQHGIARGSIVALVMPRSRELTVSMLATLQAGAAFLPIDPNNPPDRIAFMLSDSGACAVVVQARDVPAVGSASLPTIVCELAALRKTGGAMPAGSKELPQRHSRDLAYVIYTSGSTGQPKGVMVEHRGLMNEAQAQQITFAVQETDRVLQLSSPSFDALVFETFLALGVGATLVIPHAQGLIGRDLEQEIKERKITVALITPSALATMDPAGVPGLQVLVAGGESSPPALVARWAPNRRLYNAYGPTEASIWTTVASCAQPSNRELIGRPIANTQVYILDADLLPVGVGVIGEICIGGVGVARGYVGRPALTAERFAPDPFGPPGGRLYRTGDLGRFDPDGQIQFMGRNDNQVKLRGYRIELGEIEAVLKEHPSVRDAAVIVREDDPGDRRLVAYVVQFAEQGTESLRAFVARRVPSYMVPSAFVPVDSLPRTTSGKLDRAALPPTPIVASTHQRGRDSGLARVWAEVLSVSDVQATDDFFDLGGHSILAVQLAARLSAEFGVELDVRSIFEHSNFAEMAELLRVGQAPAIAQEVRQ